MNIYVVVAVHYGLCIYMENNNLIKLKILLYILLNFKHPTQQIQLRRSVSLKLLSIIYIYYIYRYIFISTVNTVTV